MNQKIIRLTLILLPLAILWIWEIIEHAITHRLTFEFALEMIFLTFLWVVIVNYLQSKLIRSHRDLYMARSRFSNLKDYSENIVRNLPIGILTLDGKGVIKTYNPAAQRILMLSDDIVDRVDIRSFLKRREEPRLDDFFTRGLVNHIPAEISRFEFPTSSESLFLNLKIQPIREQDGDPAFIMMIEDITESILYEKQLSISKRLIAASQLMTGIAHKIKNPLTSIAANIRNLKDGLSTWGKMPEELIKMADITDTEIKDLNQTIRHFLKLTRPVEPEIRPLNINELFDDILTLLDPSIKEQKIHVDKKYDRSLSAIMADKDQLRQAFLNIILNALEAMPAGGHLVIDTLNHSEGVRIKLRDDGCGIDQKNMDKIFDFYFTTKREGSGMGLSIAFLIIEQHQGKIKIKSEKGKGTLVVIDLPKRRTSQK